MEKVAVVTGGGSGIGFVIAQALVRKGYRTVILGRTSQTIQESQQALRSYGEVIGLACDVSDEAMVQTTFQRIVEETGRIDILVNNAGTAGPTASLSALSVDDWDSVMRNNLRSTFLCSQAAAPHMIKNRWGRIINLSSLSGKRPLPYRLPYVTAKMGIIGFTRTLAVELGPYNITVNAICPGFVDGDRIRQVIRNQSVARGVEESKIEKEFLEASPLNRFVRSEDIADMVVYLSTDHSAAITGEDINITAGVVMY